MATYDLTASTSGATSSTGNLEADYALEGFCTGESYSLGELSFSRTGLTAQAFASSSLRGLLSSNFAFASAFAEGNTSITSAQLGVERSRIFGSEPCECFLIEPDGSSAGDALSQFRSRWQRHIASEEEIEWTEGKNLFMSSQPTTIINHGVPLTGNTNTKLWIDSCSYDPNISWPSAGNKNISVNANFSSNGRGFIIDSEVSNPSPTFGGYFWQIPTRTYSVRFKGTNCFEIRLADNSDTRGLRLGYAYKIWSDRIDSVQSGEWSDPFSFYIPETVDWHLIIDYYIKTSCDFSDPAQERNVAFIHHEANLSTKAFDLKVGGIEKIVSNLMHTAHYFDMDKNMMDQAMERHIEALWEQLDNFIYPEEPWQMYPIRLDGISMNVTKQNQRIDFQLSNQYPVLTYTDAFVDRILNISLDSSSPASISQNSSTTPL